jgi:malate dehydrogenase (oxaloacetate-decarboxylating)
MHFTAAFSVRMRVRLADRPGAFAKLAGAIANAGGLLDTIELSAVQNGERIREITILAGSVEHIDAILASCKAVPDVVVEDAVDRTLAAHKGGKLSVDSALAVSNGADLAMVYTPGVARVSELIAAHPAAVWELTVKSNSVAVVTDGTAVLGLGRIGPEAALPVMEGKALLFKRFANIDAWPSVSTLVQPMMSWPRWKRSRRRSVASIWKTSPRPIASKSSNGCPSLWRSRCFMTISTAPRSS